MTDVLSPKTMTERFRTDYEHVELRVVNAPDATGSHMKGRLDLIRELQEDDPRLRLIDQYSDPRIPQAYELFLLSPLYRQLRGEIAGVFAAVGTGGLANGLFQFRERYRLNFPIFAVDADGSCLARPPRHGAKRRLSGYGNGIKPPLMMQVREGVDRWISVKDQQAVSMCHRMLREHGISVGPSSGAVLAAAEMMARYRDCTLPAQGHLITILPDGGEPYAETVFNTAWLKKNKLSSRVYAQVSKQTEVNKDLIIYN